MAGKYQVRSISLPSSSATDVRIEQDLNSLKSCVASSASSSNEVCSLLAGLEEVYNCADELVSILAARETLSNSCERERWAGELFDGSVKMLDVCSSSRETMLMAKGHVQDIQSALRRRYKGDSSIQKSISGYLSFRKQMTKSAMNMIALLKQINHVSAATISNLNEDSSRLIKVLQDVSAVTISVFESLLAFLAAPSYAKTAYKWSLVSRLMTKREAVAHDCKAVNEFACVDAVIFKCGSSQVLHSATNMQVVLERLAALEIAISGIDDRLECIFRCLITLRVSLLNRMSI